MKKILLILISEILLFTITGCNTTTTVKNDAELNQINGVTMTIKENTLTRSGATVVINDTNRTRTYSYGEAYRIDKKENGQWEELKPIHDDYGFNEMAYYTDDDGKLEFNYNWEYIYGQLENGEYRLAKSAYLVSNTPVTEDDKLYFSVEFNIE